MSTQLHPRRERQPGVFHTIRPALAAILFMLTCGCYSAASSGAITISPSSLNFGTEAVGGQSAQQVVAITNSAGRFYLRLRGLSISAPFKIVSAPSTPLSLGPGQTTHVTLAFDPTTAGNFHGTFAVTYNSWATASIALAGATTSAPVSSPGVTLSSATLTFSSQTVGTTSAAQTVNLTNTGQATLDISNMTLAGADPSDFALSNGCGSTLAAGASCAIAVSFKPVVSGTLTGTLSIADNATGSPQSVSLSGTGASASPAVTLSPSSLTFASQTVGTSSSTQSVTLTNTGQGTLNISSIALTGTYASDFSDASACGSTLAAGSSCAISVAFKPATSGTLTAAVTFTDNAGGGSQTVSLTGTGAASTTPTLSLSASSLTFSSQTVGTTSAAQTVTLTNTGQATLNISSIALAGADPSDFSDTSSCGSSLAAGANCTVTLSFKPAAAGTLTATLSIADNASGSPQSVSLSGTGASATTTATLSSTSISFGSCPVDVGCATEAVTLSNTGSILMSITGISITGTNAGDFTENSTCGSSLTAGATCAITMLFTPTAYGTRTASLTVSDSATGSQQTASLSGAATHDVILTWSGSLTGLEGFNVYRGTTSGGESSTPLNSTPIAGDTYTDANVTANTEYFYVLRSVASNGTVESTTSNEASATVP